MFQELSAARMNDIKPSPKEQSSGDLRHMEIQVILRCASAAFPSYFPLFERFSGKFHSAVHGRVARPYCDFAGQIPMAPPSVAFV
jgi:hypothetical protein